MAPNSLSSSLLLLFLSLTSVHSTSLYLSPHKVLFSDYQKMLSTFKIYTYPPPKPFTFATSSPEHLFHSSLLESPFLTKDPTRAHLFLVPFPHDTSPRALSRFIRELRVKFPYWNRTLGADHFFISRAGIDYSNDRNALELKKNSVQVSSFSTTSGKFIPHKDITLPPNSNQTAPFPLNNTDDGKYCMFNYGDDDVARVGQAMRSGCVPVVITDRPIQDLPLMDVLRWHEIAVFVGSTTGGVEGVVSGIDGKRYEEMRRLGVVAAQHLAWNSSPQPLDAFHMVMYQLWLRRHTVRYARWESV